MACTSSTGTTAAPVTPRRSDDRSCSRAGVGQQGLVQRGRAGQHGDALGRDPLHHPAASKTGSGTTVAPAIRQARMPALYPKVWKNGLTTR